MLLANPSLSGLNEDWSPRLYAYTCTSSLMIRLFGWALVRLQPHQYAIGWTFRLAKSSAWIIHREYLAVQDDGMSGVGRFTYLDDRSITYSQSTLPGLGADR